jgi:hypothetical protein
MILGRSALRWLFLILIAICVFILVKWAIPLLFGALGIAIPDLISTVLALLVASGVVWGGYGVRVG